MSLSISNNQQELQMPAYGDCQGHGLADYSVENISWACYMTIVIILVLSNAWIQTKQDGTMQLLCTYQPDNRIRYLLT